MNLNIATITAIGALLLRVQFRKAHNKQRSQPCGVCKHDVEEDLEVARFLNDRLHHSVRFDIPKDYDAVVVNATWPAN